MIECVFSDPEGSVGVAVERTVSLVFEKKREKERGRLRKNSGYLLRADCSHMTS